jgi:hypothetical protein
MKDIEQQLSEQLTPLMGINVLSYVSDDDAFERIGDNGAGLVMYTSSQVLQASSGVSKLVSLPYRQLALEVIFMAPTAEALSVLIEKVYQSLDSIQLTGYRKLEITADRLDGVFDGIHNGSVSMSVIKA